MPKSKPKKKISRIKKIELSKVETRRAAIAGGSSNDANELDLYMRFNKPKKRSGSINFSFKNSLRSKHKFKSNCKLNANNRRSRRRKESATQNQGLKGMVNGPSNKPLKHRVRLHPPLNLLQERLIGRPATRSQAQLQEQSLRNDRRKLKLMCILELLVYFRFVAPLGLWSKGSVLR